MKWEKNKLETRLRLFKRCAILRLSLYHVDNAIGFPNDYNWIVIYPVDST